MDFNSTDRIFISNNSVGKFRRVMIKPTKTSKTVFWWVCSVLRLNVTAYSAIYSLYAFFMMPQSRSNLDICFANAASTASLS